MTNDVSLQQHNIFIGITARYKKMNDSEFGEIFTIPKAFINMANFFRDDVAKIVFVPICTTTGLDDIAKMCAGVIITGSHQYIKPSYHGNVKTSEDNQDYEEYIFTSTVIDAFEKHSKGILGICYGAQALNVYYGGTLKNVVRHNNTHHLITTIGKAKKEIGYYNILYDMPTIADLDGYPYVNATMNVNSYHEQAVDVLADPLSSLAVSEDGTIELFQKGIRVIGVQWHPELDFKENEFSSAIFLAFFRACVLNWNGIWE